MEQKNILAENLIRFGTKNLSESNIKNLEQTHYNEGVVGDVIAAAGTPIRAAQNAVSKVMDKDYQSTKGKKISIAKYSSSILNVVKKVFQVWNEMDFGFEDTERLCNRNGAARIDQMFKEKVDPIAEDIADIVAKIRADEGLANDKEAILALHRSMDGPAVNFIMGTAKAVIGGLASIGVEIGQLQVHRELMDTLFAAVRSKFGEEGRILNAMISDIMGRLGVEYHTVCNLTGTSWKSKNPPPAGTGYGDLADQ